MHGYLFTLVGIIMVVCSFTIYKDEATIKYSMLVASFFLFVFGSFIKFKTLVKLKKDMNDKLEAAQKERERKLQS
ncbi:MULTISPECIES: hypothetical protein [unclassified Flammeovirga]|uniref:hypothetical protein n=1 Tax=unclassified Flammeovirga TaxID=2637820 RepID=UPI0005C538CA|nr:MULTISPECIES: hypothetical protein [unclassified Flammeovirga]MBD0400472.1 hypothetical protein [Flammeovirga sp. EKP202]